METKRTNIVQIGPNDAIMDQIRNKDQRESEEVKRGQKWPTRTTRGQKKLTGASRGQK